MKCIFCSIIQGDIPAYKIWEDAHFFVFLDIHPLQKGHTLLIPKNHTEEVFDLSNELYVNLFSTAQKLSKPLREAMGSKKIGLVIEGFGVAHAHIHLIPINNPHELDPNKAYNATEEELRDVQETIIKNINN